MNNEQFRKLALGSGTAPSSKNAANSAPSGALGSRQKASIPMTPRHGDVGRVAFARQMAERYGTDKTTKFRTSQPKGSRLAAGYVDRAKLRAEQEADDRDRQARLAALEDAYKRGDMEPAAYEARRRAITDGDRPGTPVVQGLDGTQLGRVPPAEEAEEAEEAEQERGDAAAGSDVDDAFAKIEGSSIQAVQREKTKKRGQYATTLAPGQKRSRDQILAEMKAARAAAKQVKQQGPAPPAEPALGSRFKKIGAPQAAGSRIETDSRGREVLIIVDEDGHEKRKVRKASVRAAADDHEARKPDGAVLGMDVPEFYRKKQEAEAAAAAAAAAKEVDIFDDAGSDYDPLAGVDSGSDSDDAEAAAKADGEDEGEVEDEKHEKNGRKEKEGEGDVDGDRDAKRRRQSTPGGWEEGDAATNETAARKPNYFGSATLLSEETSRSGPLRSDPSVLAALRKAKQMREAAESEAQSAAESKEAERAARLQKLLQSSARDAEDLDLGFGANRLDDTEDLDEEGGKKVRLSKWKGSGEGDNDGEGDGDGDGDGGPRGDKAKRKRGGKKRKGDGNNVEDVMRVLERRREGGA